MFFMQDIIQIICAFHIICIANLDNKEAKTRMTSTQKSPLLEASKKYKRRKQDTEYNLMGSETIYTAIIKEFDSTTQTDVNSISTRVGAETFNSDDFNSVCVKVEADEWCNVAACFYSGCVEYEQVQGEEICQETEIFYGRGKREDVYIPCPGKTLQVGTKKEPVLDEKQDAGDKFPVEHKLRILNALPLSQFGSQEVFLEFEHDQFMPSVQHSSSDLTPVIHLALKTEANTSSTSPVQVLPMNVSSTITCGLVTAASSKSTDAWGKKECCDISIIKEVPPHQPIGLSSDVAYNMDRIASILPVNDLDVTMPLISYDSKSNLSHKISESQSNKVPLSMSSKIEEVAMTSEEVNSNLVNESGDFSSDDFEEIFIDGDCSSDDFEEIFIERNKGESKSYPLTLSAPTRVCGEGSSRGFVKTRGTERENAAKTTVPLFWKPAKRKLDKHGDLVSNKSVKKAKTPEKNNSEDCLQERNQASCTNLEPPDDDHFLYCVECNKEFEGDCAVHGPYNYIQDKEVPEGDPHRADHTLPDDLAIKTSTIFGAGLGVFTKVGLESRIMFGPYEGDIIAENNKSGYCWQIYKEGKTSHFVDAQDKSTSNWMRYVNCAMKEADQNLVAFQYKGGIYYCTFKPVSSGEELLVWYGDECARELVLNREDGFIREKNLHSRLKYANGEEIFQCVYCKIAFTTAVLFVRHLMRMHGGDQLRSKDLQVLDQWRLENDDQYLISYSKLINRTSNEKHLNSISNVTHNKSDFSQSFCDEQLTSVILHKNNNVEVSTYTSKISNGMKTFKRIPTGKRLYKCDVRGYASYNKCNFKRHMGIHTSERVYKCEVCGNSFTQSSALNTHMRIHKGEKLFKCEVCGNSFTQSGHLKRHMMTHTGEKLYKCEVCGNSFTQRSVLNSHMRIHTGEKPYKCQVCCYECIQSSTLKTHMTIHIGEKLFKCGVCGYACNRRDRLKRHMRIHTGEKPYRCEVCGYECIQSGALKTHMAMHTGEKLFKSEVCGYVCNLRGHLKTHMRVHTGEKLYKCGVCSYAFNQNGTLKTHMRIHTGEKPYNCEVCGHSFTQSSALNTHMRIHTGEKLFKCEVCGNSFTRSDTLKTHMRIHTGERRYKCEVCGYGFSQKASLNRHMKIHTGVGVHV
ncbi:histone-lysine N-methyltransferase PRDM9-like isoform X2 [Dreissena polymorpha]|nr:histone-lysine N-methyltransferase PRDM9-like isoform X2 [Dreissena polymorpha]